jgi:hypothetical protein
MTFLRGLSEQGMVISKPNPEGWAGIFCPNAQSHTDGNPEGRYMPATRSYCCLHGHCVEFDTKAFLAWVAENGGPAHDGGLRDDLLAEAMEQRCPSWNRPTCSPTTRKRSLKKSSSAN